MIGLIIVIAIAAVLFVVDVLLLVAIAKVKKQGKETKCACSCEPVETEAEKEILAANDRFDDKEEPVIFASAEEKPIEEAKEEPIEEAKEEPIEEAKEEPVEEAKEEPVEAAKEEPVEEPALVEEAVAAEEKPAEKTEEKAKKPTKKVEKKEEKPVEKKAEKKEAKKPVEKKAEKPAKEEKKAPVEKKEEPKPAPAPEKKETVVRGKIEICNAVIGGFHYILRANNGQLLYESKNYKSVASCRSAIDAFIEAVKVGMFTVRDDKFDRYKFILKSPTSNNVIYVGESFDNERSCQSNIESVRRFAVASDIVDSTDADFKAHFSPYVISQEVKDKVKNNNGVVGKWAIEQEEGDKKNAPYVFLLYASNGQLLYESRDYSNYSSCKNGLMTFRKTIQEGEFIIDPDKAGRYKFILRNTSNNSLMEYIGQNYSTERACADGIDSIYRFALVSPVDKL